MIMSLRSRISVAVSCLLLVVSVRADGEDWPMLGRDITRNPVSLEKSPPSDWDVDSGRNIKWKAKLGSMTHGTPVIADGHVYIGTNNAAGYLQRYPDSIDLGCLLCFRESDGEFLWQYSAEKLPTGRVHDWPMQGIGASPLVEGDRMWFVSNRWEVLCLDTQGFRDGENDGPVVDEPVQDEREADVVWKYDMMKELGVMPHNQGMGPTRRCSPAASYKNRIYVVTGNGVDSSHVNIPTPEAPSLVCLDKNTGRMMWTDNSPGANLLHGQFASPLVAEIASRAQVIVPQGDGWIRSFDALSGELIWKFDSNRKESKWILGGRGDRNNVLATPVLYRNRIYIANGQEVEHGEGPGWLLCIDPTRTGDISAELAVDRNGEAISHRRLQAVDPKQGERAVPNPNSGLVWEFTSQGEQFEDAMHRTIANVAVHNGLLVATDYAGLVHCFDAETGKRHWHYDTFAAVWSTPLIVDDRVYVADEDGEMAVFALSADPAVAMKGPPGNREPLAEIDLQNLVAGSPVYANGTLYVATRSTLFAITDEKRETAAATGEHVGGHWPGWRGPHGNNISSETGLLQEWPAGGPPLVWRADGLGEGIASLSIAGGRIVTICQHEETEYVRALDEATGAHLWTARLGSAVRQSPLMRWLTQRAPAIDGDRLYAVSLLGELVCLRAGDGAELWRRSYADEFGGQRSGFGYADCPLVDGKRVICTPGGAKSPVIALDRESGEVLWTCAVADAGRAAHAPGVIAEIAGTRQVITYLEKTLVGIAVDDGTLLWRDDSSMDRSYHPDTPIVRGNELVLINGRGPGMRRARITHGDNGFQFEEVYSIDRPYFDRFHDSAFLVGDHVYEITRIATCLDWKTGDVVWQQRVSRRPASATWADGRFYVHSSDGLMKLFAATPAGYTEKGSLTLADHQETSGATAPVVAGGHLYVREDDRLFCYRLRPQSTGHPSGDSQRVELPQLARAAAEPLTATDPANDPRRILKSAYSPTPQDVVAKMLALAGVKQDDVVFDLGSGDGRIVITAAKEYGCRAVGYEIDGELVKLSRQKARDAGVSDRVTFHQADLFTADLSEADVVALYLLPIQNKRLIPQLKQLPAGARIVSHEFEISGLVPDKIVSFESDESGESHRLSLFTTPLNESEPTEPRNQ